MVLTKQSLRGDYVVYADLSIPALEIRHVVCGDLYEVVARYCGRANYNSTSLVKRMFKNIELH